MLFFPGLHQPSDARHFERCMVSVNRLKGPKGRKSPFPVGEWLMDSGAFTEITTHGRYRESVSDYAAHIKRWANNGRLLAAASQDYMCESFVLAKTGLSVRAHQLFTVSRYRDLSRCDTGGVYVLPVLQGYEPFEYVQNLYDYGDLIRSGAWVGVGSVCKRNRSPEFVEAVLRAILAKRPDLRLHGFGLKVTALDNASIRSMLYSADSMAWSYAARVEGRSANDWREAARFVSRINRSQPVR